MKTIIEYVKSDTKVNFEEIQDKECFYSAGTLYMKILQQDLDHYKIDSVNPIDGINAISILNAGLTFFTHDEKVYRAIREHQTVK